VDVSGLRTNLDKSFIHEKKKLSYPYIYIPKFGEEIALMVTCLEPGPLPLVLNDEGVLKQVGTCSLSALELAKLLRVYKVEVVLSPTEKKVITGILEMLEVLPWMVSSSFS
jgi:hypothetical protein